MTSNFHSVWMYSLCNHPWFTYLFLLLLLFGLLLCSTACDSFWVASNFLFLQTLLAGTSLTTDVSVREQSCPTLCGPVDRSPPGSSVHGIFQARILEWLPVPAVPNEGIEPASLALSALAGGFFTTPKVSEIAPRCPPLFLLPMHETGWMHKMDAESRCRNPCIKWGGTPAICFIDLNYAGRAWCKRGPLTGEIGSVRDWRAESDSQQENWVSARATARKWILPTPAPLDSSLGRSWAEEPTKRCLTLDPQKLWDNNFVFCVVLSGCVCGDLLCSCRRLVPWLLNTFSLGGRVPGAQRYARWHF